MKNNMHVIKTEYNIGFAEEMKAIGAKFNSMLDQWEIAIEKKNEAERLRNAYFGASKIMTPFQKKAANAVRQRLLETTGNKELIIKKDDDGLFVIDAVGYSGKLADIKKDLKPCGLTISKTIGKRMYISKLA